MIETVLSRLEGLQWRGQRGYAKCPAHDDRRRSLSLALGRDGQLLLKCHAGCTLEAVVTALQMELKELWPEEGHELPSWLDKLRPREDSDAEIIYDYVDETGRLLYQVIRYPDKQFRQRRPEGAVWVWNLNGVRRVLYRLPELIAGNKAEPILICEGEKDVESLIALDCPATTGPGGAGKWSAEFGDFLKDRDVVILPDNDKAGKTHADLVSSALVGIAKSIKVLNLPGLAEHGDVTDWLALPHMNPVLELAELIANTKEREAEKEAASQPAAPAVELKADHFNADRFLAAHGETVRWSPELGRYFVWDGAWWREDRTERVQGLALGVVDNLRPWVAEATGDEFRHRAAHYSASARAGRIEALLQVARAQLAVGVDELDQHPYLIACPNGEVDLRTGELRPSDPAHLLTKGVDIPYDSEAKSELWQGFLLMTFDGDRELVVFVQRLLGYATTGAVREHIAAVPWGSGANGKSTLIGAVQDLLGELAITAPEGLFTQTQHQPHPERIAALRGRRLVVCYELENRAVLAEGLVKTLTGGDRLSAREMHGRRFDFAPTHKIMVVTNHKPRVRGTDESIWRRLRLVPFEHTVRLEEQDPNLRRKLVEDSGQALLAWLVQGAVAWYEYGLGSAGKIEQATAAYRAEQDTFAAFLTDCTEDAPGARTPLKEFWEAWREWCDSAGERPGRQQDFSTAMEAHGGCLETYQGIRFVRNLISRGAS